jgi:site-specific recombinase XerD
VQRLFWRAIARKTGKKECIYFADQVVNRYLKRIAMLLDIQKKVTYHTSRHTFGTLMSETGHLAETQKMMGHSNIKTSMSYVHTSNKNLIEAKKKMFSIPIKNDLTN